MSRNDPPQIRDAVNSSVQSTGVNAAALAPSAVVRRRRAVPDVRTGDVTPKR
jgi:hypothetical protein